jgi:NTP pyrophosphatase (non-canonical NTP hydrolase)
MNFDEYQVIAESFAVFEHECYPAASLIVESAELADLFIKPQLRGDKAQPQRSDIVSEAGDVLWNLAVLLKRNNIHLSEVAQYNTDKLTDRRARGVIKGSGGNR